MWLFSACVTYWANQGAGTANVYSLPLKPDGDRMTHRLWRCIAYLIFAATLLSAQSALASNERISVSRSANGTIVARIDGLSPICPLLFLHFASTSTRVGTQISISTPTHVAMAVCPFTPDVDRQPLPYTLSADLGILADGVYALRWTTDVMTGGNPTFESMARFDLQTRFFVSNGTASIIDPQAIPTISSALVGLLVAIVSIIGLFSFSGIAPLNSNFFRILTRQSTT